MKKCAIFLFYIIMMFYSPYLLGAEKGRAGDSTTVSVTVLKSVFPTYLMGSDEQSPMLMDFSLPGMQFFRGNRPVYPYTFQNQYSHTSKEVSYEVVRLENEYIVVDVIPDLRGRVQGAIDKRNGWDFLYYNHVIKPAEIAVRSAWIAGGIEWNHPGGHGYSQLNRIPYRILEEDDGSKSVMVGEIEPNRRMKWETVITLRPGRLYVEVKGRFLSIKPYPVPFTSSTNAAMHATDEMEMIYPPGTYTVGHGNNPDPRPWPWIDESGADYSWFKETHRSISVFATANGLKEGWYGVYSHDPDIDAGTVIINDPWTAPGKKYLAGVPMSRDGFGTMFSATVTVLTWSCRRKPLPT